MCLWQFYKKSLYSSGRMVNYGGILKEVKIIQHRQFRDRIATMNVYEKDGYYFGYIKPLLKKDNLRI